MTSTTKSRLGCLAGAGVAAALALAPAAQAAPTSVIADANTVTTPWGVGIAPNGSVYVTDLGKRNVAVFDSSGRPVRTLAGGLQFPSGVAIGRGKVFVTDRQAENVKVYDAETGINTGTIGAPGVANGQFKAPEGVTVSGDHVLVASQHRFQRFTTGGTFVSGRGGAGAGFGQFDGLAGIAASSTGGIYTSETVNDRVQRFGADQASLGGWGATGLGDGQFRAPQGIAVDPVSGEVLVTDRLQHRVQRFSPTGTFLGAIGAEDLTDPIGVAVDCRGSVYVADDLAKRVVKYGPTSAPVAGNLLVNGDFEQGGGSCDDSRAAFGPGPGWTTVEGPQPTAVHYGARDFPAREIGDGIDGGESFVAGGPAAGAQRSVLEQVVDVSAQALDIDDGRRLLTLSGHLGGFSGQDDAATVAAIAVDGAGRELGTTRIGPVTPADRGAQTAFLPRRAAATLPKGTRQIRVRVTLDRANGSYNDAYADNLVLTLTPQRPPVVAPTVLPRPPLSTTAPAAKITPPFAVQLRLLNPKTALANRKLRFEVGANEKRLVRLRLKLVTPARSLGAISHRVVKPGVRTRKVRALSSTSRAAMRKQIRRTGSARVQVSYRDGKGDIVRRTFVVTG